MKILGISDIHFESWKNYSSIDERGINSRLTDTHTAIKEAADYSNSHNIDLVVFGGDLLHRRKTVEIQALNLAYDALDYFNAPMLALSGNHDQSDRNGDWHSLQLLKAFGSIEVIDKPKRCETPVGDFLCLPYSENRQTLQDIAKAKTFNFLLAHVGVQGAKLGSDYVYQNENDPSVEDLHFDNFDFCFLGHFHSFQYLASNAVYIGSSTQHNWGDSGDKRGFVVYDTETKKLEHIELDAPKFIKIDKEDLLDKDVLRTLKGNFVRITSDEDVLSSKLCKFIDKLEVRSLEVIPVQKKREERESRLQADIKNDSKELINQYVKTQNIDGLDVEYLISMGLEILQEVEGK